MSVGTPAIIVLMLVRAAVVRHGTFVERGRGHGVSVEDCERAAVVRHGTFVER